MPLRAAAAARPGERCLMIFDAKDGRDEAAQIARGIADLVGQGRRYREVAVLYRTRHMSRALETALRHAHIPYSVRGSTGFYDRAVIRDALAYLRVIDNPNDNLSLARIANLPARGLSQQSLAALSTFAAQDGVSLSEVLGQPEAWQLLAPKAVDGARLLASLLARWRHSPTAPPRPIICWPMCSSAAAIWPRSSSGSRPRNCPTHASICKS